MVCDFCRKNEAVLFIEQLSVAGKKKINLCMECAVKYGISPDPKSIESSIGSLFSDFAQKTRTSYEEKSRLCPVCGQSLSGIKRTGYTGCPECYSVFSSEIKEMLKAKNILGPYTGSMPARLTSFRSRITDRMDIQAKLNASLKSENYEKAAMYRDYLKALERSSVSDGSGELFPEEDGNEKK
ncbi:UvrB/UvrC motif-containing protein [Treponema parvum]|uniref:UvrB/UvrC motif-containing protein n=1 Tax=Treponema parvum TaxID=138851 RepID=A0A975IEF6_9SPIR|nr:UvrB/UvrC motif-containing protein [Treponema parvum]QTQ13767.1 UvrB/UvrC motif-containing protein [Treponema parvum]